MSDTTADPIKREFLRLVETKAEPFTPSKQPLVISPEEPEEDDNKPDKPGRGAPRLLRMMEGCKLLIDPADLAYIVIDGTPYQLDAKNPRLCEVLAGVYYRASDGAATLGKDAVAAAVAVWSDMARDHGERVLMANRSAAYGDALFYDLGNNRAARIAAGTWEIIAPPPGMFRPWQHKLPHPEPVKPGNAARLFEFSNVPEADRLLVLATIAALIPPGVARPALVVTGCQGSGKSTFARFVKMLIDPSTPALTMVPRKVEDVDLQLVRNHVLALDNLSTMPPDVADLFSAVITRAGLQRRVLHTTSELLTLQPDIALIFTSISALSSRPDFMERTLRIILERIEDTARLADDELDAAFDEAAPEILGGLLSLLAAGLELLPRYRPEKLPRMASFARIAAAIAEAAEPGGGNQYLAAFFRNQGNQHLELAETNQLFSAVLDACNAGEWLTGGMGEVAERLREIANPAPKDKFPAARGLRTALERLRVPLLTAGIRFEFGEGSAKYKSSVSFHPVEGTDQAPPTSDRQPPPRNDGPPPPPEPPELSGLVFDVGELDL